MYNRYISLLTLLVVLIFCGTVRDSMAVQEPRVSGREKRFRTYVYNPNEIYRYTGHYMYQSFIEFGEDETIQTLTMGDNTAWQINNLENRLFLKPIGSYPETNMTIITNRRIYHFELDAKEADDIKDEDLIFVVRFVYPDDGNDNNIVKFPVTTSQLPDLTDPSKYNFNYEFTGNQTIAPIKVFDNGEFTYMEFPDKNADIPAIFLVDSDGFEALINFRVVGNYIVVERVASQFTLRSGGDIVCVFNNSVISSTRR